MNFRSNQPFVGSSAFAHKGGMHVHAVNRISESYEHIRPESVGNEIVFMQRIYRRGEKLLPENGH